MTPLRRISTSALARGTEGTHDTCVYLPDPSRSAQVPKDHLGENAKGILSADRCPVYKTLGENILVAFCWSHVRGDFVRVRDGYAELRPWAETRVRRINALFQLNDRRPGALSKRQAFRAQDRLLPEAVEAMAQVRDRATALPLPPHRFDPCIRQDGQVDKYETARFDNVRYSVPRVYAFRTVTIKGYVDRVEIVADGRVITCHDRCDQVDQPGLDPIHYVVTLGRRQAALDHADVYRQWRLPGDFLALCQALETRYGPKALRPNGAA